MCLKRSLQLMYVLVPNTISIQSVHFFWFITVHLFISYHSWLLLLLLLLLSGVTADFGLLTSNAMDEALCRSHVHAHTHGMHTHSHSHTLTHTHIHTHTLTHTHTHTVLMVHTVTTHTGTHTNVLCSSIQSVQCCLPLVHHCLPLHRLTQLVAAVEWSHCWVWWLAH